MEGEEGEGQRGSGEGGSGEGGSGGAFVRMGEEGRAEREG